MRHDFNYISGCGRGTGTRSDTARNEKSKIRVWLVTLLPEGEIHEKEAKDNSEVGGSPKPD